jgi:hypothetical protein
MSASRAYAYDRHVQPAVKLTESEPASYVGHRVIAGKLIPLFRVVTPSTRGELCPLARPPISSHADL